MLRVDRLQGWQYKHTFQFLAWPVHLLYFGEQELPGHK